jgi:hypothetical protein
VLCRLRAREWARLGEGSWLVQGLVELGLGVELVLGLKGKG